MLQARTPQPPPPDVFITDELSRRPLRLRESGSENAAFLDLARQMVDSPKDVLRRFVELAMDLTGGSSAGLSLFERDTSPDGIFRWHHVVGSLAAFAGATTPRNYSPCGVTLDRATPVLIRHSERLYSWISDAGIVVPEVLLVPLYIDGREPLGTLWVVNEVEGAFNSEDARITAELATFVGIALRMQRDRERLETALIAQENLTREMSHRLKNLFSLTNSMIRFSAAGAGDKEDMAKALSGRIHALANAHALVVKGMRKDQGSDLRTVVSAIVQPYVDTSHERFQLHGDVVLLGEKSVSAIGLVIHELTTNAVKYGALVSSDGHVEIQWGIDGASLLISWREIGGPTIIAAPAERGFGERLIQTTVTTQLAGELHYEWRAEGLGLTIKLPLSALSN